MVKRTLIPGDFPSPAMSVSVSDDESLKVIIIYLFTCWKVIFFWNSTRSSTSLSKCRTGVALLHLAWKQWTMCSTFMPSPQQKTGCRTLWMTSMNPWRSSVIFRTPAVVLGFDKTTLKPSCSGKINQRDWGWLSLSSGWKTFPNDTITNYYLLFRLNASYITLQIHNISYWEFE